MERARARAAVQYASLEPHLDNWGDDNDAAVLERHGVQFLTAHRAGVALALACTARWVRCSASVVGASDGRTDLCEHRALTACRSRGARPVALIGELD